MRSRQTWSTTTCRLCALRTSNPMLTQRPPPAPPLPPPPPPRATHTRRRDCDGDGFDVLTELRAEMGTRGLVSQRALVIVPGEGTTATRALAAIFRGLGLRTCHFCSMDGYRAHIYQASPHEYVHLDFVRALRDYDAILDTPAPQLFPYLLAAFPNARVVHTVRDSLDWVEARTREWQAIKPGTALVAKLGQARNPASWLSKHQLASGEPVLPELSMSVRANRSERFAEAISFSAQNAYARCITPPSQYMLVNAFRGDMCRPGFLPQLAAFLNRSHGSGPKLTIPHC